MAKFLEIKEYPARLFAVGDIHGCVEELRVLLEYLVTTEGLCDQDVVIFIGDYIDRGPDSREVIEFLIEFKKDFAESAHFLKGNHEDMLLDFLGFDGNNGMGYILNGGAQFLKSYGLPMTTRGVKALDEIPEEHIDFLKGLERYIVICDYVFAHAGLNPLRDLRAQLDEDLFWIREEFINNLHHFHKTIVFGHTPFENVLFHLPYKIGVDTGLVYGNLLSCVELREELVLQVARGASEVTVSSFGDLGGVWPSTHRPSG